jgi:spore maturation protein CgeB
VRLLRITNNYPVYLERFYGSRSSLRNQPYSVQYRELVDDCFGWADFWTKAFGKLNYEVWEPVCNAEPQQKTWAREHGVKYDEDNWPLEITEAQVRYFKPDILFVHDYYTFSRHFLENLRHTCPSIRLIMGWCGAPYSDPDVFRAYNVVLSNIISLAEHFRQNGHRCELVRHAFEPRILDRIRRNSKKIIAFSFVGSIVKMDKFHREREKLLGYLVRHSKLEIWSDIQVPPIEEYRELMKLKRIDAIVRWAKEVPGSKYILKLLPQLKSIGNTSSPDISNYIAFEIAKVARRGLYGLEMYQAIHDSLVTFNNHIDISTQYANNMRLFEATGAGACLLTDWKKDLGDLFEPDVEVATYQSAAEAAEKAEFLLTHENVRREIAERGKRRTLREHTFDLRAIELDAMIKKWI